MTTLRSAMLCATAALLASACAQPALNSERIAAHYGSYHLRILEQDSTWRISSLESRERGASTTRTLAIVRYARPMPGALRELHRRIVAGGSIGATMRAAGWVVDKKNLYSGMLALGAEETLPARLMRISPPAELAVHAYRFDVSRGRRSHRYATIVEIHHPDYLSLAGLRAIYRLPAAPPEASAPAAVQDALRRLRERGGDAGQTPGETAAGPPAARWRADGIGIH